MLTPNQAASWERDGFFIVRGFAEPKVTDAMHERAIELAREAGGGGMAGAALVQPESRRDPRAVAPEDGVSKIFKVHREEPSFRRFIEREDVLDLAIDLLAPDLDCFLSQFIFKNPGAIGQPWHQDSYYFRFDRTPQVGIWLAVTRATLANGCLHVLAGSHREPVHEHVVDRRPDANLGYVEIVDHDMSAARPVEMEPGDLLVFHSHLMHRSTDNQSDERRAAMVYHLAAAGTLDRDPTPVPINDWLPVRRRIETQVDIAAPVDDVWRALTDTSRYPEWNPYLVRVEGDVEADADVVARGRGADGSEMLMPVRVVSLDAPVMHWEGGLPDRALFKGDHFFELEALEGARTRLHHYEHFTGSLVGDIVVPREATIRENFERMNLALRRHCEGA